MSKDITISKSEYERLKRIAKKYEVVRRVFSHDLFEKPDTDDANQIVKDFRATGLYNEGFLKSLKRALKESDYFARE